MGGSHKDSIQWRDIQLISNKKDIGHANRLSNNLSLIVDDGRDILFRNDPWMWRHCVKGLIDCLCYI